MKNIAPLAIVAAILLVFFAQLGRDATAQAGLVRRVPWPPLPENMVTLRQDFGGSEITLQPDENATVYDVHAERYFVVTGFAVDASGGSVCLHAAGIASQTNSVLIDEGKLIPRLGTSDDFGPMPLGVPCNPGSRIHVRNEGTNAAQVRTVWIRGYLVDAGL